MINRKKILVKFAIGGLLLSQGILLSPIMDKYAYASNQVCPPGPAPIDPDGLTPIKEYDINGLKISASSEESNSSNEIARNLADNNPNTSWCTKWDKSDKGPKYVTLNLGKPKDVSFVRYLPRQNQGLNGIITKYKISVSNDGVNFNEVATGNWALDETSKVANFKNVKASFIRLEAIESYGGWASGSEINYGIFCPDGLTPIKEYDINGLKISASSEESNSSNEIARNLADNNPNTSWCTKWDKSDKGPKYVTLNLGKPKDVSFVMYLPRQNQGLNGIITKYKISVSNDGVNFNEVATGDWTLDETSKTASFKNVKASFIRLEAIESYGGWASGSEVSYGSIGDPAFEQIAKVPFCPDGLSPNKK